MDWTTTTRVKALGGWDAGDTQHDAVLDRLIDSYSQEFERRLDRVVEVAVQTDVRRIKRGKRTLSLRAVPLSAAPTSIKYNDTLDFSVATALVENTDYVVDLTEGLIEFLFAPTMTVGWMQIVYTGGMAADTAAFIAAYPALAEAIDAQVVYHYRRRDYPGGSRTVEGGSTSFESELNILKGVERALLQYRRRYI